MKKIKGFLILLILLIFSIITFAQVDYNQAKGVAPNTRFSSGAGNENINIMNGNLMFSFTDASLPGRNGLYPSLTRMYNSKIWHNCLIRENGKLKKTLTIKEIGEFGVGWSLGVPTLRIRSKNKSDTMVQDIDDHVRFPISDEFVLIETDGSEHTFAEPNENLLFPGYLTSYTTDNSYYLVKFKAEDFDIETPNSYSDDVYLPKSPTSRIEIFTKSGVLYEAYPNYRDRTALKDEIEVINGEDISDDVIDSWIQAIQDSYPLRKYRWLDYKVLKIQDTNGNYFKYNYESKANTITVSIEIDREKIFTPPHIQVTSSPDEIMQYIFQIINSANIRELDQEPSGENYDITYNEDSVYFEFPLVETLKYDTISSIEDSNGYKIEINWDEWTYKGGLDVNYIKNIRYKNSNNEVLTVKYEYINRTINAGSVYTVSTESRNVKLLKRVRFLKSGIDIINPFIYDYDGNGHLNKIIYPVNNSNNLDSNGIKMNPDDATKGIVEYSYHRYNYYAPYDIEKLKDIIHEEGNSSPKVFTHCTYGVLTRKEDRDQDKETKYYRVCNPENASFPALVRIEFPDNSNEVHYYINEGIWKRYQNRSIFINSPYSGYERCTEFYEGEVSFNLFNLQVEGCLVQKIEFEWITQQFPEDWFINNPPTVYNTRLMSKTIHKYDKINQALVYSTGFKNIVFDNYGNVKLLRNKRKLRDNDGNLYIDDDIKLIKTFLHETDIEYRKRNILNKTKIIKKEDINGKLLSKKEFIFDDYSINPGNIPENYSLNDSDLISIYYDPSKKDELIRGNLTKSITYYGEYDETGNITWDPGKDVIRNFGYDIFGNQIINVDAMGNITTKTFDPSYKYSMPTQITNPKNQTSLYNYYPNTYLLKDTTNINGNVSLKEYDSLDRTVKVTYPQPDGGHTLYEYNDLVYPIYTIEKNLIDDSSGEKYAESIYYFDCWSRYIYGAMKEK
ncbi:hypothetical protein KAU33_13055, partial [Candidatus Dependentiae bacterium]|nr:hypothetical protein [Candidatus Dependentiae bacterium]